MGQEDMEYPFHRNTMASKGMNLNYFTLVIQNGVKMAKLVKEEVDKKVLAWRAAMILYVVGDSPTISVVSQFIDGQGTFVNNPSSTTLKMDIFLLNSITSDERDRIVHTGPHMINNKPVIVKPWSQEFNFNEEVLNTIPLWTKLLNLPLQCWG
ncbi:hypothetical protein KY290_021745 [Solanum tuberosum]|uniref:DUF4283 domain-containing protein n=1 Tax=Solanum tuberosum TaxID=4113 RepID=A0ABQ7V2G2_SOLTU|nr:hypothetical protein KY289_020906 [Solanum tuberosum]KAH0758252.1 hypothetical protein KY290_021745 [Solanum tuberosum]